jgi:type II secretory pathway component GspD/PulD (secretin)
MRKMVGVASLVAGLQLLSAGALGQQRETAAEECRNELAKVVSEVGTRLQKRLQIDPRVRGCVQGRLDVPSMTYRDLQALLALHGFVDTMELDGIIQIVPDAVARQQPLRLIDERSRDVGEFEMVMKVVDTTPLSASHLVPILRPLLSQYSHLVSITHTNSMLVVARYANVRALEYLLQALKSQPLVALPVPDRPRDEPTRSVNPPSR